MVLNIPVLFFFFWSVFIWSFSFVPLYLFNLFSFGQFLVYFAHLHNHFLISGLLHFSNHIYSSSATPHLAFSLHLILCALFPSTHQSLALASPLRTYGMMDRRASGASKAKGHLPGALRCREALGPAKQPQHHTSVYTHSHVHTHTHTQTLIHTLDNLGTTTFISTSYHVMGFVFFNDIV